MTYTRRSVMGMLGAYAAAAGLGLLEAGTAAGLGLGEKERRMTAPRSAADPMARFFRLRAVSAEHPDPGPGGTHLTAHGIGNPVTVEPSELGDQQKWWLSPVEGKDGMYTIILDPASSAPLGLARGESEGDEKVVLSSTPDEWRLAYTPAENSEGDVFAIHTGRELVGAESLLATGESSEAVVKTFPVSPGDRPAWLLLPASG